MGHHQIGLTPIVPAVQIQTQGQYGERGKWLNTELVDHKAKQMLHILILI